jgi:hypothetical protein
MVAVEVGVHGRVQIRAHQQRQEEHDDSSTAVFASSAMHKN